MFFFRKLVERRRRFRLKIFESLEPRQLLSVQSWSIDPVESKPASSITAQWFTTDRQAVIHAQASQPGDLLVDSMGPKNHQPIDWIVQLSEGAIQQIASLTSVDRLLSQGAIEFQAVRGLGKPGLVQVRSLTAGAPQVESALAVNEVVTAFSRNTVVTTTRLPNDSEIGNQFALNNDGQFGWTPDADIDAAEAWDQTTGSWQTVVGVIDSGIDLIHPDLYLNIWINQGEIRAELREQLIDVDADGLITFFDLNDAANAALVQDFNRNQYIDAEDLLADPLWADGVDTDRNGFIDDFFGWNFRTDASVTSAPNNPGDQLGHGTHVAGIIGASGDNARGVTGINWRTSLMSLKFLDQNNQGDIASAIAAVNYATMMRTTYDTNVRVLNASWGQAGSAVTELEQAIADAGTADILFVAAAGNGNVLGVGVDNDRTAFYPASYASGNILAVAASDGNDQLASFSNYGLTSVDLAAPGVGIRSTLPGGQYGDANGTSMAAPMVSGTAALIWSALPQATMSEVRHAILNSVDSRTGLALASATGGRLNAAQALDSPAFAPTVTLLQADQVRVASHLPQEIVVRYRDRNGIDVSSIDDFDLLVTHQWGTPQNYPLQLKPDSLVVNSDQTSVEATYLMSPPGGDWDVLDFGHYSISTLSGSVTSQASGLSLRAQEIGNFRVEVAAPNVIYLQTFGDPGPENVELMSLRRALDVVNANPTQRYTIFLDAGRYRLEQPHQVDPEFNFGSNLSSDAYNACGAVTGWSNASSGDLDVFGQVTIIGNQNSTSLIDAQTLDRVFKVHQGGQLTLERLTITGGQAPVGQGGGGVLSAGSLSLKEVIVRDNNALGASNAAARGGGIAAWSGVVQITQSHLKGNAAQFGGALFTCGSASTNLIASTLNDNSGGGFVSYATSDSIVDASTIASNSGGAIASRARDLVGVTGSSFSPAINHDGSRIAFLSSSRDLVTLDSNDQVDAFVFEVSQGQVSRASVSSLGEQANLASSQLALSANGQHVLFTSEASNLVAGDSGRSPDAFVRNLETLATRRVSTTGSTARATRGLPAISGDGQWIAYQQTVFDDEVNNYGVFLADQSTGNVQRLDLNLADGSGVANINFLDQLKLSADGRYLVIGANQSGTPDRFHTLYIYDRTTDLLSELPVRSASTPADGSLYQAAISQSGRYITFAADDSRLVDNDTNGVADIFVFDQQTQVTQRVSLSQMGEQANAQSSWPSISGDGRWVVFASQANNLIEDDQNGVSDILMVDRTTGSIQLVSRSTGGQASNGASETPVISGDGNWIAFTSSANDLMTTHANHRLPVTPTQTQVYLASRTSGQISEVSRFSLGSSIHVTNSTLVYNTGTATLAGNVTSRNSLMAGNLVEFDLGSQAFSGGHNIYATSSTTATVSASDIRNNSTALRLSALASLAGRPPGYELLEGNPALDAGASQAINTLDQWQRLRSQPDIGALEAVSGSLAGRVFLDLNRNGLQDSGEAGLAGQRVYLDSNNDGLWQVTEPLTLTSDAADPRGAGFYQFDHLPPGTHVVRVIEPPQWAVVAPSIQRVGPENVQGNGPSTNVIFGVDGRNMAFVSTASNLVSGDTSAANVFVYNRDTGNIEKVPIEGANLRLLNLLGHDDRWVLLRTDTGVFLYDRSTQSVETISRTNSGQLANNYSDWASASQDGRWFVYSSFASNLVSGDSDNFADIFLWDRQQQVVVSLTAEATGVQGNNDSEWPVISDDGSIIAFVSDASNLVSGDTNALADIFVYRTSERTLERVTLGPNGVQSNGFTYAPKLSGNGRYVLFQSLASNLVAGDTNEAADLFVYDLHTATLERLDIPFMASSVTLNYQGSISVDGQYVTFEASNAQLNLPQATSARNIFVYDRSWSPDSGQPRVRLVSEAASSIGAGQAGNDVSSLPSLSRDGREVAFQSRASNLTSGDTNGLSDGFVAANPFEVSSRVAQTQVGQVFSTPSFALTPNPGTLAGILFHDVSEDRVYDEGDPVLVGWTVFIDTNTNGRRDAGEPVAISDSQGSYRFNSVGTERDLALLVEVPINWEQVAPTTRPTLIYLPAGGQSLQRNFAFRQKATVGQSQNGRIEGRVFDDLNRDGIQQSGEIGLAGIEVYLDLNSNGRRDFDEPRVSTDAQGNYSFINMAARNYVVRAVLGEGYSLTSPLGNQFDQSITTLSNNSVALAKPQAVTVSDFDGVNGPDIAVALFSANSVIMQLNEGQGQFGTSNITVSLPAGSSGPYALASGQLNGRGGSDLVVANLLNSTLSILLDFSGQDFLQKSTLAVGAIPYDVGLADLDGDGDVDLLVATQTTNQAGELRTFLNNGQGQFSPGSVTATRGKRAVALATGDFNADGRIDVAVANQGDFGRNGDSGNIAVLIGRPGGFNTAVTYTVGSTPVDVAVADLNGDSRLDLVTVNFSVNTATMLRGEAGGLFTPLPQQIALGQAPVQVELVDIDGDGDRDMLFTGNPTSQTLSIVRNRVSGLTSGEFSFEPGESFGVAQVSFGQRLGFTAADLDGNGTPDLAIINSESNSLRLLTNQLIAGANRVQSSGTGSIGGQNFGVRSEILLPQLGTLTGPATAIEDAGTISLQMSGLVRARTGGLPLRVTATSSNPEIVAVHEMVINEAAGTGRIDLTTQPDANGSVHIAVEIRDAGADGQMDTGDDGVITRTHTLTLLPVNDPPSIALAGNQVVTIGSNQRIVPGFASGFMPGGGSDESAQTIAEFIVNHDRTDLFLVQPTIDNQGTLRYQPRLTTGTATVQVRVRDSGGTELGGLDRSLVQTFEIKVIDLADGDIDFGDAPSIYPVAIAQDGARHQLSGLYLGVAVDAEPNGQPSANATGDDANFDDEDGVEFILPPLVSASQPTLSSVVVLVTNSTDTAAYLDAWLDFNQDGDWNDSGEQIFSSAPVTTGRNLLSFTIPAGARSGVSFARFRLSHQGSLMPTGLADAGEVEDYAITLLDAATSPTVLLRTELVAQHEWLLRDGQLQLLSSGATRFSAPASGIGAVHGQLPAGNDLYVMRQPDRNLIGSLNVDAQTGSVRLLISQSATDLAALSENAFVGIDRVELNGGQPQSLRFEAHQLAALGGSANLRLVLGTGDTLLSQSLWELKDRQLVTGQVVHGFQSAEWRVWVVNEVVWQNPFLATDTNGDGVTTPLDALLVINVINSTSSGNGLPVLDPNQPLGVYFVDVNGNQNVTALDALLVINVINSRVT